MGSSLDPLYLRHVKDRYDADLNGLLAAAESVSDLLDHPGWALLHDLVGDEIQTIERELDHGRTPLSRAQYAMAHGRRGGLLAPAAMARTLVGFAQKRLVEQQAKHEGGAESSPRGTV